MNKKRLKGIKGWLLVYVIFLAIVLFGLISSFILLFSPKNSGFINNLSMFDIITSILSFSFTLVSFVFIFMKKKTAIMINQLFLFITLIIRLISIDYSILNLRVGEVFGGAINIVWFIYWFKSDRVKNTFVR